MDLLLKVWCKVGFVIEFVEDVELSNAVRPKPRRGFEEEVTVERIRPLLDPILLRTPKPAELVEFGFELSPFPPSNL